MAKVRFSSDTREREMVERHRPGRESGCQSPRFMVWIRMSPTGSCVEGLAPNAALFRDGTLGQ
jgi:hypothetical protein